MENRNLYGQIRKKTINSLFILTAMLFAFIIPSPVSAVTTSIYNVTEFGAVGDGETLNTTAIQAAIDECTKNGGGTVYFPAGTYLSGTIYLKDHIRLFLDAGSILLGSKNVKDYPLNVSSFPSGADRYVARALIWGDGLEDITITGQGTINGQGSFFTDHELPQDKWLDLVKDYKDTTRFRPEGGYINRPYIIRFVSCRHVLVEKISLLKPAMWMQLYQNCDYVTIRDIYVFSHGNPNNDLIDIDGSRNVIINGVTGDSDDDGITLKSTSAAPVQNVTISDCIIRSRTNAIKAGTESSGGFKDITITNCVLKASEIKEGYSGDDEGFAGIALEIVDGGSLDRVTISNIAIEDMAAPIFLRLGNRARPYQPNQSKAPVGTFQNVKISNITASNAGKNGCSILGIKDHYIKNVLISNVHINFDGGGSKELGESDYLENDTDYPESTRYGDLPAYGFFCRHVDGLTFRDVRFTYNTTEHRPPLICDDVKNLKLFNFSAQVSSQAAAQMIFRNTHDVFVSGCSPKDCENFMRLEDSCSQVKLVGNDLSNVIRPFVLDETMQMSALAAAGNISDSPTLFSMLEPLLKRDEFGQVSIKSFTTDSVIRYTLDGTEPTLKSKKYESPFQRVEAGIVKAKVFKNGLASSTAIADLQQLQVIAPVINPVDSYFNESIKIDVTCATPDADIRYTLDDSEPDEKSSLYKGSVAIKNNATLLVRAFKKGHQPSDVVMSQYESVPRKKGVQYKYSVGKWEKLPDIIKLDAKKTGVMSHFNLDEIETNKTEYSLLLIGFLDIKKAGEYTFYCGSNDGSSLTVDNTLLIENDGPHGFIERSGVIYLTKGIHRVEVRYFQYRGSQSLKVSWKGPDFEKREITATDLK